MPQVFGLMYYLLTKCKLIKLSKAVLEDLKKGGGEKKVNLAAKNLFLHFRFSKLDLGQKGRLASVCHF